MTEEWSQWLDFDSTVVGSVPESAGVFVMHASMKVLYIGASSNVRSGLMQAFSNECCTKAKRFKFILTETPQSTQEKLLKEYAEKHQGTLPLCNGA